MAAAAVACLGLVQKGEEKAQRRALLCTKQLVHQLQVQAQKELRQLSCLIARVAAAALAYLGSAQTTKAQEAATNWAVTLDMALLLQQLRGQLHQNRARVVSAEPRRPQRQFLSRQPLLQVPFRARNLLTLWAKPRLQTLRGSLQILPQGGAIEAQRLGPLKAQGQDSSPQVLNKATLLAHKELAAQNQLPLQS